MKGLMTVIEFFWGMRQDEGRFNSIDAARCADDGDPSLFSSTKRPSQRAGVSGIFS